MYQCARFISDPRESHKQAVLRIGRYLMANDEGIIFRIRKGQNMELWCDRNFCSNWRAEMAHVNKSTAKSRTRYVSMYVECPVTWASKIQTEVALSMTEAELTAMSDGLRTAIPLMNPIEEMAEKGIGKFYACARVHCKVFEDNAGAMTITTMPKIIPRTKYINGKYWHLREHWDQISIHAVSAKGQIADLLTKPLAENVFRKLKNRIMGKSDDIGAYFQGSVRKLEEMRTPEQKGSGNKNDANIYKANSEAHEAICESEYHSDANETNVINADKAKEKSRKVNLGR